jgi:hypothetical protein
MRTINQKCFLIQLKRNLKTNIHCLLGIHTLCVSQSQKNCEMFFKKQ